MLGRGHVSGSAFDVGAVVVLLEVGSVMMEGESGVAITEVQERRVMARITRLRLYMIDRLQ